MFRLLLAREKGYVPHIDGRITGLAVRQPISHFSAVSRANERRKRLLLRVIHAEAGFCDLIWLNGQFLILGTIFSGMQARLILYLALLRMVHIAKKITINNIYTSDDQLNLTYLKV